VVPLKIFIRSLHPGEQDYPPLGSGPGGGKFRIFLDIGPNFPQGNLSHAVDGKLSVNAGVERFLLPNTSIEGIFGYHSFDSRFISNPRIWQLSVNGKQYFGPGPLRFFVNGGAGAYRFDPGSTTKLGGNLGLGVIYDLSSDWSVEGVYNYHTINTGGSNTQFSTVQVGVRYTLF
jgi:opacity protein-like surface antigen